MLMMSFILFLADRGKIIRSLFLTFQNRSYNGIHVLGWI